MKLGKIDAQLSDFEAGADGFLEYLRAEGALSGAQSERVRRTTLSAGVSPHISIQQLGLLSEEEVMTFVGSYLDIPVIKRSELSLAGLETFGLNIGYIRRTKIVPLSLDDDAVDVLCADPFDERTFAALAFHFERTVRPSLASRRDVEWAIEALSHASEVSSSPDDDSVDIEALKSLATEQPVVRYVNRILEYAIARNASDIHLEPCEGGLNTRLRIDGVLADTDRPAPGLATAVVSRIKIMGQLDIAERRLPQDGRIRLRIGGNDVDLRLSTLPTVHGESVVLRVLDRSSVSLDFPTLGFEEDEQKRLLSILNRPNGIFLVTGPTGSGKTTTLYTALQYLNDGKRKIFSVEDPVEYQVDGVNQIQVHQQLGLSFAKALRAILRQDPDVIMVGEIRDLETAQIAIQAALTGHRVMATLHTNSAASAITRLLDMGVDDFLLASAITGVLGQRLVRRLCPHCAVPAPTHALRRALSAINREQVAQHQLKVSVGCQHCGGTGFRGRTSVCEILPISRDIQSLIMDRSTDSVIEQAARSSGMETLLENGVAKSLQGQTTLDEVFAIAEGA